MEQPVKRFLLILCAFTLLSLTPAEAQTAQPSAGPVPRTTTIQYSTLPDLIEVVGDSTTVVGYAKKADVFGTSAAGSKLAVWDRNGTVQRGWLHPNGAGYAALSAPTPPPKNTPRVHTSPPPSTATWHPGTETAFTGRLIDTNQNPDWNYCGLGHAQIGAGADAWWGASITRSAWFYGACAGQAPMEALTSWLGVRVTMMRNNQICGQSSWFYNVGGRTSIYMIEAAPCTRRLYAEWRTVSNHQIWSASQAKYISGYNASPWMVY
jgi:hypothetical protein